MNHPNLFLTRADWDELNSQTTMETKVGVIAERLQARSLLMLSRCSDASYHIIGRWGASCSCAPVDIYVGGFVCR